MFHHGHLHSPRQLVGGHEIGVGSVLVHGAPLDVGKPLPDQMLFRVDLNNERETYELGTTRHGTNRHSYLLHVLPDAGLGLVDVLLDLLPDLPLPLGVPLRGRDQLITDVVHGDPGPRAVG